MKRQVYWDTESRQLQWRDDQGQFQRISLVVSSSGTTDHAALSSNLAWTTSGHTGTATRLAGWDGSNVAAVYSVGNGVEISGTGLRRQALTGDATASAGSNAVTVVAITETGGPTSLAISSIADQEMLYRNGSTVDGTGRAPPKVVRFAASGTTWQHYTIPLGHKNLSMDLVGGGSGGGNGQIAADGNSRRGGQGGGTGNHTVWEGRVPDGVTQLSILVGRGGTGGSGLGGNGGAGESSIVAITDSSTANQVICQSGFNVASGGFSGANGGTGGGVGESDWNGSARFDCWGQPKSKGSQNGAAGGNGAAGTGITPSSSLERTAGAGGGARSAGNTSFAGGGISASGDMAAVTAGAIQGGAGGNGVETTAPYTWTGGAGGAGGSGAGGTGGNGALGCGGGGGGGGVTASTGIGGNGGDGWVEIRTW